MLFRSTSERKAAKSEPASADEDPDADLPEVSLPIDPVDEDRETEGERQSVGNY